MPNFVVSSLPAYVQTNRDLLIKNFGLLGRSTRQRVAIQTGVKKDAYINLLDLTPALQDGSTCAFNAQGEATLSQREIETAAIKVNMDICPKTLLGTYAEYLVRVNATENSLPFEQYIMDGVIKAIDEKIETLIWQGDTTSANTDLKWINGWLKIAQNDAAVVDVAIAAGTTALAALTSVYTALPEAALDRDPEIYVSPAFYRGFILELVAANYYHYAGPQGEAPNEFYLPGTNAKVVSTKGLAGTNYIVASFPKNLVYGCDMEGDNEDIKVWFSDDDDVLKLKALWNSGVQFVYPDMVVLGTIA